MNLKKNLFILLIALTVCNSVLYANSFNIFGVDSRSTAMGNAYTAIATDPTGFYYNPAATVFAQSATTLEVSYLYPYVSLDLEGKSLASQIALDDAADVQKPYGFTVGSVSKVATLLDNDLAFGILVHVSRAELLIKEKFKPAKEPISLLYEEQPYVTIVLVGLSYKVNKYISLGAGLNLLADTNITLQTDSTASPFYGKSAGGLPINYSPHLGLLFRTEKYSIGMSYRGQKNVHVSSVLDDKLTGTITQEVTLLDSPAQATLGASYLPMKNLTLAADIGFVQWSQYTPPWLKVTPSGGVAGGAIVPLDYEDPKLKDTILPKFGVEYILSDTQIALRAGYIFRKTPVPPQRELSNLIDSDTHIISTGVGYAFTIKDVPKAVEVDFHFQYQMMTERETIKSINQDANPTYPGFTASGDIYNAGITVKFNFQPAKGNAEELEEIEP